MVACFLRKTGYVAIVPPEQHRTVNSVWYTAICLPVVFQEIRKFTKTMRALPHRLKQQHFWSTQNIDLMSYPPYSPDLTPNDFFLFPYVKNNIRGQRFSLSEEAVDAFRMHVLGIPQSEWQKCFDNWFNCM